MSGFAGLAPCVHCGFCLQSCPTYLVTGDEADSPRGRIVLMRALAAHDLTADDPGLVTHLDRCLGCRACEPVCPSGVVYGAALEAARERIARTRPVPLAGSIVLAAMARPALRGPAFAIARALRPFAAWFAGNSRLGFAAGMLAATRAVGRTGGWADGRLGGWAVGTPVTHRPAGNSIAPRAPTAQPPNRPTAIFHGCIQSGLFGHVNAAAERTLAANGYAIQGAEGQGCCGALHAHAGLLDQARALARANVIAFGRCPTAWVTSTAAGCGAMLRGYGELLADDPLAGDARALADRTRDVTELLAEAGPRPGAALALRVAYDPPCHLLHAQGVAEPPFAVFDAIPQLEVVPHDEPELCCGSAGIYGLTQPEMSRAVLARKVRAVREAGPDVIATGNPGCGMQIGAGLLADGVTMPVVHPVELLDASYAAAGLYQTVGEA